MAKVKVNEDVLELKEINGISDAASAYDEERETESLAKKKKEKYKEWIYGYITVNNIKKEETIDAGDFEIEYTTPTPQSKINKEKLLALGVALELIEQATEWSKESPRLNVKRKKEGEIK